MNPPTSTLPPWQGAKRPPQASTPPEPQSQEPQAAAQPPLPEPIPEPPKPKAAQLPWQPREGIAFHTEFMDSRDGWQTTLRLLSRDTTTAFSRPEDRSSALLVTPIREQLKQVAEQSTTMAKLRRLEEQLAQAQKQEAESRAEVAKLEENRQRLVDAAGEGLADKLRAVDTKLAAARKKLGAASADSQLLAPLAAQARQQVQEELKAQEQTIVRGVLDGLQAQRRVLLGRIIDKVSAELWELAAIENVIRYSYAQAQQAVQAAIAELA